eukprot:1279118-Alexandrium_andersonii.AAC.1
MKPEDVARRLQDAKALLHFNIELAWCCWEFGGWVVWEHQQSATSWQDEEVQRYQNSSCAAEVIFDQCSVGLVSKVHKRPMRKPTRLMGTALLLLDEFRGKRCQCSCSHQVIIGCEGGMRRSLWAQFYPPEMCRLLAKGVWRHTAASTFP